MEQNFGDYNAPHLEQQLLDTDGGDTGNVPEKNEAGQASGTSAKANTCPSNCSSKDHISLMDSSKLQADMEFQRGAMEQEYHDYFRKLGEEVLDVNGGGSVNVSENEVLQASAATFANPNGDSLDCFNDEEIEALFRDFVESLQPINNHNMPQEFMDRTPTDVAVSNDMPLGSSLHVPLMHQTEELQSGSNVPMHQSQPIVHQFNSQMHHHLPNPTVQFSPQVPTSAPVVHMPLPMNQFNQQQNITLSTIPVASMPTTAGSVLHRTQPHHMSPAMTRFPQISTLSPFHIAPHHSTPQNHIVHSVPPITHQCNPQNLSNGVQYNPQPHHHELPPSMTSLEFSSDFRRLSNGQHLVNHQPYSDLEAPRDVHTVNNRVKRWSEEEHSLFLSGIEDYGWGKWKEISINVLKTRTPTQIASHAQKFFVRQKSNNNRVRKRKSINDITRPNVLAKRRHHRQQHQNQIVVPHQNQFVPSSSLPVHDQSYGPQNPTNIDLHNSCNF